MKSLGKLVNWVKFRFTPMGQIILLLTLFCAVTGINTVLSKVYLLFASLFGFLVVAFFLSRRDLTPFRISLEVPEFTSTGEVVPVRIHVAHAAQSTYRCLSIHWPRIPDNLVLEEQSENHIHIDRLGTNDSFQGTWWFHCRKRGVYLLGDLVLEVLDPFGIMRNIRRVPCNRRMVVFPRFQPLRALDIPASRKYQPGGVSLSSSVGDSVEFFGVREFREGDDISKIHWKSWAKQGKPIVKEFQEEYFVRIALILDTSVTRDPEYNSEERFEYAVSLTASITNYFARHEYLIDIFATGPHLYHLTAGRSLAYQEQILEILACVEPSDLVSFPEIQYELLTALRSTTSVILVMLDWDETRRTLVEELLAHETAVKLIMISRDGYIPELPDLSAERFSYHCIPFMGSDNYPEKL